jgi:ribosomal protein S18 acetylase RimI-like enzyme
MEIRQLTISSYLEILKLFEKAVSAMRSQGIDQWDEHYPNSGTLKNDLKSGTMYAAVDEGNIVGVVTINEEQDPSYSTIKWEIKRNEILVVHRLCIDPDNQGRGIATRIMHFVEQYARTNKYRSIRLDAFSGNPAANSLYRKLNYSYRGDVYLRKGKFNLYEKEIIS